MNGHKALVVELMRHCFQFRENCFDDDVIVELS